jgi:hypothetical protein
LRQRISVLISCGKMRGRQGSDFNGYNLSFSFIKFLPNFTGKSMVFRILIQNFLR